MVKNRANKLKHIFNNFTKKILITTILVTNMSCYLPAVSLAVEDGDERYPATVPAVANEIISKYVNTSQSQSGGSSSNGYGVITTYEESGKDWRTITEVTAQNGKKRTYRNYKQYDDGNTYWNKPYSNGKMYNSGCGPTAIAIVLSGYRYDMTPADVVDIMAKNEMYSTGPGTLSKTLDIFNIEHSLKYVDGNNDSVVKEIRGNLEEGRAVMIGVGPGEYTSSGHWMVLVGIEGDTVTISNPGRDNSTDKLSKLVSVDMSGCGYIVITEEDDNTGAGSITSSNKNETSKKSNNKSSSSSSGTGTYSIEKYPSSQYGYASIFTSGTTGRQFKEYKQSIPGWDSKYKISHLPGTNKDWTGECGLVSAMIVGSGYSERATFEDATKKMEESSGWTNIPGWTGDYTGQNVSFTGYSSSEMVNKLSQGYVAIIHGKSRNVSPSGTHYMAILDIKPDKSEVYVSNPWEGTSYDGWLSVSTVNNDFGADIIAYVKNDGSVMNYNGSSVTTLDNFLFIGDSRTAAIESDLEKLGSNITAIGVTSSAPSHWLNVTKTGSGTVLEGTQFAKSVTLPAKSQVKGVSVALGVNNISDIKNMEDVLTNLLNKNRYPDTPIFVNSVFYVGSGYSGADKMNADIDKFNEKLKELCNTNSNLIYIDVTKDLHESKYLKAQYKGDEIHLNTEGNEILVRNIKEAILGSGKISSSNTSINMSRNIVKKEKGGYKIDIDLDEEVEFMLERLEEEDYDISKYVSGFGKKQRLKNMLKAAIVTQYPDLRDAKSIANDDPITDPKEVQGCVKIKRYTDERTNNSFVAASLKRVTDSKDDGMYLEYMDYEKFMKLINNTDASAMNYFSIDSSNNIVVAGWETMEVNFTEPVCTGSDPQGYTPSHNYIENGKAKQKQQPYTKLTTKSINYLDQISGYNVPFSLLWTLLVYGNDQKFVNDFAELIIDTEIVIGCYDLTSVHTNYVSIEYKGRTTIEASTYIRDNSEGNTGTAQGNSTISVVFNFEMEEIDTKTTDNPTLKVKYANTWTAEYNPEFKVEVKDTEVSDPSISESDEEVTIGQDIYQKVDGHYTENDKSEDKKLAEDMDAKIESESNKILSENLENGTEEANKYNSKFQYRYNAINKVIDENGFDTQSVQILKNKDIQNLMINMIISGTTSEDSVKGVFNKENALVVKRVNDVTKDEKETNRMLETLLRKMSKLQEAVHTIINNEDIYNEITKNGKDKERNKTYNAEITSVQISEYEKLIYEKETIVTETTESELKEIPNNKNVRLKKDKNASENSFVKLLYNSSYAKKNLDVLDWWFFNSMEETAAIADMVDLIKFLFQCTYNQDYGIDENKEKELKNLFDPKGFKSVLGTGTLEGQDTEAIYNYLIGKGLTNAGAAGVMGNFEAESHFFPNAFQGCYYEQYGPNFGEKARIEYTAKIDSGEISRHDFVHNGPNGGGYGIAQFTFYTIKEDLYDSAKEKNVSIGDLQFQLDFLVEAFEKDYKHLYSLVTTSDDLYECTYAMLYEYENPQVKNIDERYAYAQKYYK